MSGNFECSLDAIKSKNGGNIPSDLYFKTNSELGLILYNLTGKESTFLMCYDYNKSFKIRSIYSIAT